MGSLSRRGVKDGVAPAGKPDRKIRADSADQLGRWQAAAAHLGVSFNAFALDALDRAAAAATGVAPAVAASPARRGASRGAVCSRERFHRAGVFCKGCGTTIA